MDLTVEQELIEEVRMLSADEQKRILALVKKLNRPKGTPGREFIEAIKDISISPEDLETMRRVIEEDQERIDLDEWDLPS